MQNEHALPFVVNFDHSDDPADAIHALMLGRFVAGTEPVARSRNLQRVRPDARLLPPGVEPARQVIHESRQVRYAQGDGWSLRVVRWKDATAYLVCTATSDEVASAVLDAAVEGAVNPLPDDDTCVEVGFWHHSGHGPKRVARSVEIDPWNRIRRNYSRPVAEVMDTLVALEPKALSGRLLLLHGPPGTGKTTLLRGLAHAWRRWCIVDAVLDPDRLFADPAYLTGVMMREATYDSDEEDEGDARHWRMLILEDCDELMRNDAKSGSGQSLARLLNLTDGLLGQAHEVLVCISTNENISALHPAVTRPGRCLSQLHVGRLSFREATDWIGDGTPLPSEGATLAELYALRGDIGKVESTETPTSTGFYL